MISRRNRSIDRALATGCREVMSMPLRFWYSVYGASSDVPSPSAMADCLRPQIDGLAHEFDPDDEQWRSGHFRLSGSMDPAIIVQRKQCRDEGFLSDVEQAEDCLREMLHEPNGDIVTSHICRAQQIIHLVPCPSTNLDQNTLATMCEQLCGILARTSAGLIQVPQEGFFDLSGESLLPRRPGLRLTTS
jgi:hypothetical protein